MAPYVVVVLKDNVVVELEVTENQTVERWVNYLAYHNVYRYNRKLTTWYVLRHNAMWSFVPTVPKVAELALTLLEG